MWIYNEEEYQYDEEHYGFIYEIENLLNGRKYIGRKFLTLAGFKTVKGKRKKIRKESDWKTYFGSSKELLADVEEFGENNFSRKILRLCKSRSECNYWEAKIIFERDAVLDVQYYNSWVSCKVMAGHVKSLVFDSKVM